MENLEANSNVENSSYNPEAFVVVGADDKVKTAIAETLRLYDANAVQVVYVDVNDDDGNEFQVSHTFAPHSDEHFFQFDEKRETLLKTNQQNKKIRLKNKAAEAYLWFWNQFCSAVFDYGDPNEAVPENWRELVPEEDKIAAVQGLFSAEIIPNKSEAKQFLSWNRGQGKTYKLDVLFNGEILPVEHRLGAKSAQLKSDWNDLSGAVEFEKGKLLENNQEMSIPASAREKVPFFDKVIESSTGYKKRVPAFIKLLIVNDYFASSGKTGKKLRKSEIE